ncbi:MAG: glutamate racemase [Candidatus Omnitrophica bacterium]|nr:glutamate racemase [Candidatus Omnitrophota bacterium]MDD5546862.1 glutamate racemase [Candidatus Omnitrophota bacterium]
MRDKPIGVFDSGVGGLTVVKQLAKEMPAEDIIYFGDTARVPYGTKSPSTIKKFSIENVLFLLNFDVKLIIIACNTSSAIGLPFLSKYFSVPIIGVIKPGAKAAIRSTRNGRVGVIGTTATVLSKAYEKEIKALDPKIKVYSKDCPLFVPLVEEGWAGDGIVGIAAGKYLSGLKEKKIDTVILGCTHYPLLKPAIQKVMGKAVKLVDSAEETAREARNLLEECGLKYPGRRAGRPRFYVSDAPGKFLTVAKRFLGTDVKTAEQVKDV